MTTNKTNDTADIRICLAKHTPTSRAVLMMLANILQGNYPMSRPKDLLADALNKSPEIPGVRNEASFSDILTNVRGGAVYFNVRRYDNEPGCTSRRFSRTMIFWNSRRPRRRSPPNRETGHSHPSEYPLHRRELAPRAKMKNLAWGA